MRRALAIAIHGRQVAEFGGSDGLRDDSLLESALARPQHLQSYGDPSPDLADLAASLAFGLARNHPFVDGNKRTALVSYRTFLTLNGVDLVASEEEKFISILSLAEGKLSERDFAAWLRAHLRGPAQDNVNEPSARYRAKSRASKAGKRN